MLTCIFHFDYHEYHTTWLVECEEPLKLSVKVTFSGAKSFTNTAFSGHNPLCTHPLQYFVLDPQMT